MILSVHTRTMILAPASCLQTRQIRWVARDLQGRQLGHQALPAPGQSAWAIAGQFADVFASDVVPVTFN